MKFKKRVSFIKLFDQGFCRFPCLVFFSALIVCCTTGNSNKKLDDSAVHTKNGDRSVSRKVESGMAPEAVLHWQSFFKSPPSATERAKLIHRIEMNLKNGNSTGDLDVARAEVALGRFPAAEVRLKSMLASDPENPQILMELVHVKLRRQDFTEAIEILRGMKSNKSFAHLPIAEKARYDYCMALALIGRGDRAKGQEVLSDLIRQQSTFVPAYVALAASYLKSGATDVAEFVAKRGLDQTSNGKEMSQAEVDPRLANLLGVIAMRKEDADSAMNWFKSAIDRMPEFVEARVNLAAILMQRNDLAGAEIQLKTALDAAPYSADGHVGMGIVENLRKRPEQARIHFERAIELDPFHARARFNLAILYADNPSKRTDSIRLMNEIQHIPGVDSSMRSLANLYLSELSSPVEAM